MDPQSAHFTSKMSDLSETHNTIVLFEAGASTEGQFDHVHSWEWFSEAYPTAAERWERIQAEVAVERHPGDTANYLYADGHVTAIPAAQIQQWVDEAFNFARPTQN